MSFSCVFTHFACKVESSRGMAIFLQPILSGRRATCSACSSCSCICCCCCRCCLLPAAFHIIIFDQIGNYAAKNAIVCHSQRPQKTCDADWQKYVFLLPCPLPRRLRVCMCVYMICGSSTNATSGKRNLRNRNRKFCDGQLRCRGRCHRPGLTACLPHSLPACLPHSACLPYSAWMPASQCLAASA